MIWIAAFDPEHTEHNNVRQILQRISRPYNSNILFLSDHVLSEIFGYITSKQKYEGYTEGQRVNFVTDIYEGIYKSRNVKTLDVKEMDVDNNNKQ